MRTTLKLARHGNSVRITLVPAVLRYLNWPEGTEVQLVVHDKHHVELVDSETFYREKFAKEQIALPSQPAAASR